MFGWARRGALVVTVALVATVVPAFAEAQGICPLPVFGPGSQYHPRFRPSHHTADVTNPWFPLKPGRTLVSTGVKDGQKALDLFVTTSRTKVIAGVRTRVVEDRLYLNNVLEERTSDYYAQDRCGNVWYFGEDTAEYANGEVSSTKGSWEAGVGGAQPGVVMLAQPTVGESYHQEFLRGEAEDVGTVVAIDDRVSVPYGSFDHVLVTEDTTPLEPQILEHKFYAPGIGVVLERVLRGGQEVSRLVSYTPPS